MILYENDMKWYEIEKELYKVIYSKKHKYHGGLHPLLHKLHKPGANFTANGLRKYTSIWI